VLRCFQYKKNSDLIAAWIAAAAWAPQLLGNHDTSWNRHMITEKRLSQSHDYLHRVRFSNRARPQRSCALQHQLYFAPFCAAGLQRRCKSLRTR
jgi:hypothetical protein